MAQGTSASDIEVAAYQLREAIKTGNAAYKLLIERRCEVRFEREIGNDRLVPVEFPTRVKITRREEL